VQGNSPFQILEYIFCKQFKPEAELFTEFSSSGGIKVLLNSIGIPSGPEA